MPINTKPTSSGLSLQSKPVGYMKRLRYERTISKRALKGDAKSTDLTAPKILALQTDSSLTDLQVIRPLPGEKSVELKPAFPSQDISIGVLEDIPKDLQAAGVNPLRAELISVFQFFPKATVQNNAVQGGSLLFDLIDVRFFERELSRTNVQLAIEGIKKEAPEIYEEQRIQYSETARAAGNRLLALEVILHAKEKAVASLDFKKLIKEDSETETFLLSVFTNVLGFSEDGFDIFSSSKLFQQLLNDFLWMLQNYTPSMFGLESQERREDLDPVAINHDFVPVNKFINFSTKKLSVNASRRINWANEQHYTQRFLSLLPPRGDDVIKILVQSVSRELTVSSGIGFYSSPGITSFLGDAWEGAQAAAATQIAAGGDPFLNLVGNVGERVDTPKTPEGSLATYTMFNKVMNGKSRPVLPFESREFIIPGGETVVPGAFAFIDNPIDGSVDIGVGKFVVGTFVDFAHNFRQRSFSVTNYCESLVGIRGITPKYTKTWGHDGFLGSTGHWAKTDTTFGNMSWNRILRPSEIYRGMLRIIKAAAEGLVGNSHAVDETHMFQCALINLAASDQTLRYHLFRLLIEYVKQISNQRRGVNVWKRISASITARINQIIGNSSRATQSPVFVVDVDPETIDRRVQNTIYWGEATQGQGPFGMLVGYVDELVELAELRADSAVAEVVAGGVAQGAFTNAGDGTIRTTHAFSKYNQVQYEGIFAMVFEAFVELFHQHVKCSIHLKNPGSTGRGSNYTNVINFPSVMSGFNAGGFSASSLAASVSRSPRANVPPPLPPQYAMTWHGISSIYIVKATEAVLANPEAIDTIEVTATDTYAQRHADRLQALLNAFKGDQRDIADVIQAIRTLSGAVKEEAAQFESALDIPSDPENQNHMQKQMAFLTSGNPLGKSVMKAASWSQLALNRMAQAVYRRRGSSAPSFLPSRTRIWWRERAFLKSMLNSPQYNGPNGENIRVITVGVPRGMVDALTTSPYVLGSEKHTVDVTVQRVLEVSVYRRDLEFESVVFKPKKFLFDPFIFITMWKSGWKNMNTSSSETFHAKYQTKLRYERMHDRQRAFYSGLHMNDQREFYPFLTDQQFKSIFYNHSTSYCFSLYYKLLFGIDVDDFGFFANDNYNEIFFDNNAKKILSLIAESDELKKLIPLGTAPWQSLVDLTNDDMNRVKNFDEISSMLVPSVEDIMVPGGNVPDQIPPQITSEQMKHFRAVCDSKIFGPTSMGAQITAPRLTDRVFMIPIDPDNFFIDEVETLKSLIGDENMKKKFMLENVEDIETATGTEKKLKTHRQQSGQYEFSDFFVQIGLVDAGGE